MLGLIVAHSRNRVIGNRGTIPWNIPGDRKRFRRITTGNIVIMGRRTYEDIGHPLPDRLNIIVSGTMGRDSMYDNMLVARSLTEAVALAYNCNYVTYNNAMHIGNKRDNKTDGYSGRPDVYIAGGESLYREAISIVDIMYVTEVDTYVDGDTYFPEFDINLFDRIEEGGYNGDIPYSFITYVRKQR